jgi:ABC-2 type transport system permease protein
VVETIGAFREAVEIPFSVLPVDNRTGAIEQLKNKKADALVVIPEDFSQRVQDLVHSRGEKNINIEFVGDLSEVNYLVSAVWAGELIQEYVYQVTGTTRPVGITETGLGLSGALDDFDLYMPGILILSVIMLLFSAAIAIVEEVENRTIIRLRLSQVSTIEFLTGVSIVQILIGLVSVMLTAAIAAALGFRFVGSFLVLIFLAALTSLSIVAFSLILAAFTRTVNEVLVVGNFPLFVFMFFTGAAFPLEGAVLFTVGDYPITVQGLMSPTHAISAVKKTLILNMGLGEVVPEILALILLTALYFLLGVWAFQRRHMRFE